MRAHPGGPLKPILVRRAAALAGLVAACAALAAVTLAAPVPGPSLSRPGGARPKAPAAAKSGAEGEFTILYGDDHAFGIIAPTGWVIDDSSGLGHRIRTVLYPRGVRWKDATTIMYESCYHRDPKHPTGLAAIMERDAATFRLRSPRGKLTGGSPVTTQKGKVAQVRLLAPTGGDPLEAIAYFEESSLVVLLVLHAEEAGSFRGAYPRFRDLVSSYQLVAQNIQTPTTDR